MFEEETSIGAEGIDPLVSADATDETVEPSIEPSEDSVSVETDAQESEETIEDAPVLLESELDSIQQEIQDALKNEETEKAAPNWFRQAIRKYEKAVGQMNAKVAPFEQLNTFLEPEQLTAHVDMIRSLNEYRIGERGVPEPQVAQFVEKFAELYPHLVGDIVVNLGMKPLGDNSGMNYFQAAMRQVGLDPARIEEYKAYLENGAQTASNDAALGDINPRYHDVFKTLEPSLQEELRYMDTDRQNAFLARADAGFQAVKAQEQAKVAEQEQFYRGVEQSAFEKFNGATDTALKAFEQTLQKASFSADAGLNNLIVQQNLTTVLTAVNPNAWGHEQAKAALSQIGVQVDDTRVGAIIETLEQEAKNVAFFQKTGNAPQEKQASLKLARAQQELIAQGQKVAAQILRARGQVLQQSANQTNAQFAQAQARPAVTGQATAQANPNDWLKNLPPVGSEERYLAIAQLGQTGT